MSPEATAAPACLGIWVSGRPQAAAPVLSLRSLLPAPSLAPNPPRYKTFTSSCPSGRLPALDQTPALRHHRIWCSSRKEGNRGHCNGSKGSSARQRCTTPPFCIPAFLTWAPLLPVKHLIGIPVTLGASLLQDLAAPFTSSLRKPSSACSFLMVVAVLFPPCRLQFPSTHLCLSKHPTSVGFCGQLWEGSLDKERQTPSMGPEVPSLAP